MSKHTGCPGLIHLALGEGANDYENERCVFEANLAALREVLDAAEVGGE